MYNRLEEDKWLPIDPWQVQIDSLFKRSNRIF